MRKPPVFEFVTDCENTEEFIRKYDKRLNRDLEWWGPDFMTEKIASKDEAIAKHGYAMITHHSSMTGETVYYRPLPVKM